MYVKQGKKIMVASDEDGELPEILEDLVPNYYDLGIKKDKGSPMSYSCLTVNEEDISYFAPLTEDPYARVALKIKKFFKEETKERYANLNLNHYLGVLFDGKPGTGKTGFAKSIAHNLITKEKVSVINVDLDSLLSVGYQPAIDCLTIYGKKATKTLFIFDEFEKFGLGSQVNFLRLLDGNGVRMTNTCFLFITNRAGHLKDTLTRRPSRVSEIINFSHLNENLILNIVTSLFGKKALQDIDVSPLVEFAQKNKEVTIDYMKHILMEHIIYKVPLDEMLDTKIRPIHSFLEKDDDNDND